MLLDAGLGWAGLGWAGLGWAGLVTLMPTCPAAPSPATAQPPFHSPEVLFTAPLTPMPWHILLCPSFCCTQLLEDQYLLTKFKGEIADKRARQNNFTRTLADVSRTLRDMGLHHVVQVGVL